jgi:hypothetical protein
VFGKTSEPYPDAYRPNRRAKRYVMHLPRWYAQSHPDEDFAETFAVWLTPRSPWRARYRGWPRAAEARVRRRADAELAGKKPKVTRRRQVDPLSKLHMTLRAHYRKRARALPADVRERLRPRAAPPVRRRNRGAHGVSGFDVPAPQSPRDPPDGREVDG